MIVTTSRKLQNSARRALKSRSTPDNPFAALMALKAKL